MLLKWCTQYVSKFRKLSRGHRWGKGQFLFHFQRSNLKECSNSHTIVLISHAGKVMLKMLQARCQQNMNWELPDLQAGSHKVNRTRDQIVNICWIMDKTRKFQKKKSTSASLTMLKPVCESQQIVEKSEMEVEDHLTCLQRNLYAGP